ncbi:MAG: hypothetical protein ACE5IO_09700 [Thermoplasmata archaeon]
MLLARKKAKRKPRKKRRNAKARYDKEHPVVPVRLHKSLKKQLAKEAEKKNLMLSQYVRDLLQGFEIRERVIERIVEKPVIKTVKKTVEDLKNIVEIKELKEAIKTMEETISSQQNDLVEASKVTAAREKETDTLKLSCSSLSTIYNSLRNRFRIKEQELQKKVKDVEALRKSASRISAEYDTLLESHRSLEEENAGLNDDISRLTVENNRLKEQLEWAFDELRSIDERNRKIARRISLTHDIQVRYVGTTWKDMPK